MNLYHLLGAVLASVPLFALAYFIAQEEAGGTTALFFALFGMCFLGGLMLLSL